MNTSVERFRRFVEAARPLLGSATSPPLPTDAFRAFVKKATPIATKHAEAMIGPLASLGRTLSPWIVPQDLLEVAGYAYVETAYTSLVGWALFPSERREVALACQRAWAARVAPGLVVSSAARPLHQLATDDGIPDLVLVYDEALLVVEAKTKTVEHKAPSGSPQTIAYSRAVPAALGKEHATKKPYLVYLTTDGGKAASSEATSTTYAELAIALAEALGSLNLTADDPLRPAYAMLITHFARCAVPVSLDLVGIMNLIQRWDATPAGASGPEIIKHLSSLQTLASLLLPKEGS